MSSTRSASDDEVLDPHWQIWVAENLLRGVTPRALEACLTQAGVTAETAKAEVDAVLVSPALIAAARLTRRLELVTRLRRTLWSTQEGIERVTSLSGAEFYARYYASQTPVILTSFTRDWKALEWTPGLLAERYGDVAVEVCTGRDADPTPDRNFREHLETMPLRDYVARVEAESPTNDLYMIAQNKTLQSTRLGELLAETDPDPSYVDPARARLASSLWVGPASTLTPLHHDTTNILFSQLHGRKRFTLIPPWETELLAGAEGFYAAKESPPAGWQADVTLEPGETLYLPAGWWHAVEALEPSVSLSFMNLLRPNAFDWYRPGDPTEAQA